MWDNFEVTKSMEENIDYESLPQETKRAIADMVAADTLKKSNEFYNNVSVSNTLYNKFIKRCLDVVISLIAIIVTLPINLIICIITFFDVGKPILFLQKRMGRRGKEFNLPKFRNMTNDKDENGELLRADLRVTKWGKFVRKTSLDELLNFYSILKGDMSLIGPRPLPAWYKGMFNSYHEHRHDVRPGLDCPLADPSKIMTWQNRLDNDVWYVENVSFKTDIKLIYLLFREVFFGKDKDARAEGFSEGSFMGYYEDGKVMDSNHIPEKYYEIANIYSSSNNDNKTKITV